MKIAQMVITSFISVEIEAVDKLNISARGDDGFGSTGMVK
ncbi:Deoxyuridine 5'-triphosphate nucleotidohydrolase (fragment) [Hyella patelloides LEGE 07179]|uniref:Deoxyuridine 5'-triphosphate nucleotidohydrolase n=2 Tax=Hyella TaxID=945733 RepID=A0A563VPB5_9CYAN